MIETRVKNVLLALEGVSMSLLSMHARTQDVPCVALSMLK